MGTRRLNEQARLRVAACEVLGLHYWSGHPADGHVWAVDDHQRAHVVRIRRNAGTAQHVCRAQSDCWVHGIEHCTICIPPGGVAEQCGGADEAVPYVVDFDDSTV